MATRPAEPELLRSVLVFHELRPDRGATRRHRGARLAPGRRPGASARRQSEPRCARSADAAVGIGAVVARVVAARARCVVRTARIPAMDQRAEARTAVRSARAADPGFARFADDLALTCLAAVPSALSSAQLDLPRGRRSHFLTATKRHRDAILARLQVREPERDG